MKIGTGVKTIQVRRDRAGVKTIVKARVCLRRIHSVCTRVGQAHNLDPIVESSKQVAESRGRRQIIVFIRPRKNSVCNLFIPTLFTLLQTI